MEFQRLNAFEKPLLEIYPAMFTGSFGAFRPHHPPDFVYMVRDGVRFIGFAECLWRNPQEVLIMFGGVPADAQGRAENVRAFQGIVERLHDEGCNAVMMDVENDNLPMLKLALASGFRVIGCRIATDKTVVCEMLKMKE